jgi:RNA polymerase sigma-70 factor (ECF subfamily)
MTASFESAVTPLLPTLRADAIRLTRDPDEADDLVQETMVRALRFWATYSQDAGTLRGWLATIMRNTKINGYHAAGRRERLRVAVGEHVDSIGDDAAVASLTGAADRPSEEMVDREETYRAMIDALARLPEEQRVAVTLADLEGQAYAEIAAALEVPIGTVMSRIFRGRKALHAAMFGRALEVGLVGHDTIPGERVTAHTRTRKPTPQLSLFGGAS